MQVNVTCSHLGEWRAQRNVHRPKKVQEALVYAFPLPAIKKAVGEHATWPTAHRLRCKVCVDFTSPMCELSLRLIMLRPYMHSIIGMTKMIIKQHNAWDYD